MGQQQAGDGREQAHGDHQQDRRGHQPAFELGRQQKVDQHHRPQQGEDRGTPLQDLQVGQLGPFEGGPSGKAFGGQLFDGGDDLARADPRRGNAIQRGRRVGVVPANQHWPGCVASGGDRRQRDHRPARRSHLQPIENVDAGAEPAVGLEVHLPGPSELVEVIHIEPAQVDLQRVEHIAQRDPQRLAFDPIDIDVDLGGRRAEAVEQHRQFRTLAARGGEFVPRPLQRRQPNRADVFDQQLEAPRVPQPVDGGGSKHPDLCLQHLGEQFPPEGERQGAGPAGGVGPLFKVVENHEHRSEVRPDRPQHHRLPGNADRMRHAGGLADQPVDMFDRGDCPFERGRVGELYVDDQVALVLLGHEPDRGSQQAQPGQPQQPAVEQQHQG